MNIALVLNGVVINTIICESAGLAEELNPDCVAVDIDNIPAGIGWSYDGSKFIAPVIEKTPGELAAENLSTAQSEYDRATAVINGLNEQIEDADYAGTTEDEVRSALTAWTDYRKQLRAYIKVGDGRDSLPPQPDN